MGKPDGVRRLRYWPLAVFWTLTAILVSSFRHRAGWRERLWVRLNGNSWYWIEKFEGRL